MRREVYCGFCRLPHKVYNRKHISWIEVMSFALMAGIVSFIGWGEFHWASLLVFLLGTLWTEFMFQFRWRQSIKCKSCGFDPMIYKRNPEEAAQIVKAFLDNRKIDPSFMLKPQPQLPKPRSQKDPYGSHLGH